jgi:hypothetical protein
MADWESMGPVSGDIDLSRPRSGADFDFDFSSNNSFIFRFHGRLRLPRSGLTLVFARALSLVPVDLIWRGARFLCGSG